MPMPAAQRINPHVWVRTWYQRFTSSRPSTNPGRMQRLIHVVSNTESVIREKADSDPVSSPSAMTSTGRNTPMP